MTVSAEDFFDIIRDHMDAQPYGVSCMECGTKLDFDSTFDSDLDLFVEVEPCKTCMEKD